MKTVFLIMGESAAGKDLLVSKLKTIGFKALKSYTSRPKRWKHEDTHIFIEPEEVENFRDKMIAYTKFDNYEYFATEDQLLNSDLYVIDPDGIEFMKNYKFKTPVKLITVYIKVSLFKRILRMLKRGDGFKTIPRILNDFKKFKNKEYDYVVENVDLTKAFRKITRIICSNNSFVYNGFECKYTYILENEEFHARICNQTFFKNFTSPGIKELKETFHKLIDGYLKITERKEKNMNSGKKL